MSYADGNPVGIDLYYDPVVDEHVAHGPMGIMAPTWYFAPQRPEVAAAGWMTAAHTHGLIGPGPIVNLDVPPRTTSILQFAGEFADAETKARLWQAAEPYVEPNWDLDAGEFTLGFRLNEAYPRGQLNARAMAGWVCTPGAWSRIFNEPNLAKFDQPSVEGVDFPRIALSEARWDGGALHLAAHPQNASLRDTKTVVRLTNMDTAAAWHVTSAHRAWATNLVNCGTHFELELPVDNNPVIVSQRVN